MAINNPYIPGDPYSYDLNWIIEELKTAIALYEPLSQDFQDLKDYVDNYFANLDLQEEVNIAINQLKATGYFDQLIYETAITQGNLQTIVTGWLNDNVTPVGSAVVVDDTLTIQGAAADSKATGDSFTKISGLSGNIWDETVRSGYYINQQGIWAVAGTPAFCCDDYIPVDPSTQYYFTYPYYSARVAQYDSNHNLISWLGYLQNQAFTTAANAAYIAFWSGYGNTYPGGISIKKTSDPLYNIYTPMITATDYVARAYVPKGYVTLGPTGDYQDPYTAFNAAVAADTGVVIQPGVYDMTQYYLGGQGPTVPKHVIGYGATFKAHLPTENWTYSPINIPNNMDDVVIEGLTIDAQNCRYCIHDEMYAKTTPYHHVFKNCHLIHRSPASTTLIRPICIGGGFGTGGTVEIENCTTSSLDSNNQDINYHSNSLGQTLDCYVYIKDSVLGLGAGISGNAMTGFTNYMYISNCKCGHVPTSGSQLNVVLTAWNNV